LPGSPGTAIIVRSSRGSFLSPGPSSRPPRSP